MTIAQSMLAEFDQEMANTRKILELVPDDKFDYKPHPKSMALGHLAGHVAEMASWGTVTLKQDTLTMNPGDKGFEPKSRQEILDFFDKSVPEFRETLAATSDEDMLKTWTLNVGDKPMFSMPRIAVIRGMVMNHIIHHRAQLGVYLRLNDIAFPGVYGPSADEMQNWATA
jgi:uncharacterized damage-inducible protein DinB